MPQATRSNLSLRGVRILELADAKTGLAGRLLTDMGADVAIVEPPGGSPFRKTPPFAGRSQRSLAFHYFNMGKRSVALDLRKRLDAQTFLGLVHNSDVLLESCAPGELAFLGLSDKILAGAHPGLIHVSITGFGQSGPFKDYAASDITTWAMSGLMGLMGDPAREPLNAPAAQAYQCASLWATIAVQAALFRRTRTGAGARVDLSLQEALTDMSETAHSFFLCNGEVMKRTNGDHPLAAPFKAYKTADGYSFIGLTTQGQWQELLKWMESTGENVTTLRREDLVTMNGRVASRQEVNEAVATWALRLTNKQLYDGGAERGIPNAPVRSIGEAVGDPQLKARKFFRSIPSKGKGRLLRPGLPFRSDGRSPEMSRGIAPRVGEHTARVVTEWAKPRVSRYSKAGKQGALPLDGVKVVEFCWHVAGPTIGRVLGDLGAIVVKVEPRGVGDPGRMLAPFRNKQPQINGSYTFQDVNRNKFSATMNIKHPEGKKLALKLASWADVVTENFTGGTLDRLGLSYSAMQSANHRLILASLNGYGQTGPRASWPSYHPTGAALAGLIDPIGYPGGEPLGFGHSHMDYVVGLFGVIGVLDALLRREEIGAGDHVDISQLESGVAMMGVELLDWCVNKRVPGRIGNRQGAMGALLQGCYCCKGDDRWLAVTAPDAKALSVIAKVCGAGGRGGVAKIEAALAKWLKGKDAWEAFHILQKAGVPAGVVATGDDLTNRDGHLRRREMFGSVPHPELGETPIVRSPLVFDGRRLPVRFPGPLLGEHTERVMRDMCRLSAEDYSARLVDEAI